MTIKFRIMSDLHLEFETGRKELFPIESIGEDYLILAGDIHLMTDKKQTWFTRLLKERSVIYVLGNHEFYGHDFHKARVEARLLSYRINNDAKKKGYPGRLHFLDNNTMYAVKLGKIDEKCYTVKVVGSTLWSNIHPAATAVAQYEMNDYHEIKNDGKGLTTFDTIEQYTENVKYLAGHITRDEVDKCLVITHHAPSYVSIADHYKGSTLDSAYASDLEFLMGSADLWVHGHMHDSSDYEIDGCRVVCNPKGYSDQNHNFNPSLIIEL